MSKLVVIFYSFIILVQSFNINIEDISKLNALLEHARYHQENCGDNFFEFLSEHYGSQMSSHKDKHEDHKGLPFKDSHHICSHINSFTLFEPVKLNITHLDFTEIPKNFLYKEPSSSFEKPSVFQPPKTA